MPEVSARTQSDQGGDGEKKSQAFIETSLPWILVPIRGDRFWTSRVEYLIFRVLAALPCATGS